MDKKKRADSAESLKDSSDSIESAESSDSKTTIDCHTRFKSLVRNDVLEAFPHNVESRNDGESVDSHEIQSDSRNDDSMEIPHKEQNLAKIESFNHAKSHNDEDSAKEPKFRSIILGAKGLSLGISIVVAILLGIGAGILMQKIFNVFWVLFLGVLWGVLAAILNVYKAYKAEMRDFDELAKNPKYAKRQD